MTVAYTPVTICAIATAPPGGVGVIRLSGQNLLPLAQVLSGGKTPRPRYAMHTDFWPLMAVPSTMGAVAVLPCASQFYR